MSTAPRAEIVSTILTTLATFVVALRCISRFVLLKQSYLDDYLIILALILSICLTALIFTQAHFGLGKHFATVSADDYRQMLKPFWASVAVYNAGLTITKLSALCQFLRFFVTRTTRRLTLGLMVIIATYGAIILVVSLCSCWPVAFFWDKSIRNGTCIDLLAFWYSNASFNIVTDFMVVGLPIYVLKDLHVPRNQKLALMAIFALGGFSCLTSILRLHSIYVVANSSDITWDNVDAAMWSAIELNTAIICACLPALKPLLMKIPLCQLWLRATHAGSVDGVSHSTVIKTVHWHVTNLPEEKLASESSHPC